MNNFIPKTGMPIVRPNSDNPFINGLGTTKLDGFGEAPPADFKTVMTNLTNNFNKSIEAPDKLLKDAVAGTNGVDIHDVVIAMSKAEIGVNIATQLTTKIVQSYEKIMAIQV